MLLKLKRKSILTSFVVKYSFSYEESIVTFDDVNISVGEGAGTTPHNV